MNRLSRFLAASAAAVSAATFAIACGRAKAERAPDRSLAGEWVQVYPAEGFGDTLVMRADGSLSGYTPGLDRPDGYVPARWHIDTLVMVGGLCFDELPEKGQHGNCQGYVRSGDTLWLANGQHTAFIHVDARGGIPTTHWNTPSGRAKSPAPGDSVAGAPTASMHPVP